MFNLKHLIDTMQKHHSLCYILMTAIVHIILFIQIHLAHQMDEKNTLRHTSGEKPSCYETYGSAVNKPVVF